MKRIIFTAIACACLTAPAWADMYQFQCITPGASVTQIDAASQFTLDVTSVGADPTKVEFKFGNNVGEQSSITQIYFYDGVLVQFQSVAIAESVGVDFGTDAAQPGHLPDLDREGFLYAVDADTPNKPAKGVNADGEWISVTYTLQSGKTFDDVLDGLRDGVIVVGIHAQAFADGGSASYIASVVPVPGAVLLGMLGIGAAGMRLRRAV